MHIYTEKRDGTKKREKEGEVGRIKKDARTSSSSQVTNTRTHTLCFIGKELVHLSNGSVVGTHHKSVVVHVQNDVLALCVCGMGM